MNTQKQTFPPPTTIPGVEHHNVKFNTLEDYQKLHDTRLAWLDYMVEELSAAKFCREK